MMMIVKADRHRLMAVPPARAHGDVENLSQIIQFVNGMTGVSTQLV